MPDGFVFLSEPRPYAGRGRIAPIDPSMSKGVLLDESKLAIAFGCDAPPGGLLRRVNPSAGHCDRLRLPIRALDHRSHRRPDGSSDIQNTGSVDHDFGILEIPLVEGKVSIAGATPHPG